MRKDTIQAILGTFVIGFVMFLVTAPQAAWAECTEILGYIRDTTTISTTSQSASNFERFFCDQTFSSYQQAHDAGVQVGIVLDGLPINVGGHDRSSAWSQYKHSICESVKDNNWSKQTWNSSVSTANASVVNAWSNCITSVGLHFWTEMNSSDPKIFTLFAKYISNGSPYWTSANGPISFVPTGTVTCQGDVIKKDTKIDSAGKMVSCERLNESAINVGLSTEQGVKAIQIQKIVPKKEIIFPGIEIKRFEATGAVDAHPTAEINVPAGYKIIGGGARANWTGAGNLLTSSYPESNTKWVASAKDHQFSSPASITAWAIAIFDPTDAWDVQTFVNASTPVSHPYTTVSVPDAFTLTGGGARVLWSGNGNLLTASFPVDAHTWEVRSKDHSLVSPASIVAYAIGMRPKNGAHLPDSKIFSSTSSATAHPSNTISVNNGYLLSGGGALDNWEGGAGNLLTASYPNTDNSWSAQGKDHGISSPAAMTVYAIGIKAPQ